ncbi:MAG: pantoate--beta-alanine ligase [Chitinophagaceae bacterium]|nr:MAG: pantoate--beta-alanine ligase [Chitinophagaceae bacterium]
MQVIKKSDRLIEICRFYTNQKMTIGFVPTMGALHQGHLSLVQEAQKLSDIVVTSIFVNPAQFNNSDDLKNYPRTISNDLILLEKVGCNIVFIPDVEEVYPSDLTFPEFDLAHLDKIMEGSYRPGHFEGVAKVVYRFLDLLKPHKLFLGQKDYQQVKVIESLINQTTLQTKVYMCPTVRNSNGLAKSSRNTRLSESEKVNASYIYEALKALIESLEYEPLNVSEKKAIQLIEEKTAGEVEYLEVYDLELKNKMIDYKPGKQAIVCVAVKVGDVRLIDNLIIS